MDLPRLRTAVADAFRVTGEATPGWPDPHGGDPEPREEEYSRCLDPGKYRIVLSRADAWATALTGLGLARASELPVTGLWRDEPDRELPARAVLLDPRRATTHGPDAIQARSRSHDRTTDGPLPLLLAHYDAADDRAASVVVGAGAPAVQVDRSPDCGCDACDFGSDGHLAQLDAAIEAVVTGDWLHVRTPRLTVSSTSGSTSANGHDLDMREARRVLEEARAGRSPHQVLRARPWW